MTGNEAINSIGEYLTETPATENKTFRETLIFAIDCIEKRFFLEEAIRLAENDMQDCITKVKERTRGNYDTAFTDGMCHMMNILKSRLDEEIDE